MTFPVEILTRQNAIISDQRRLDTRSRGVVAFACLLLWKKRTQPEAAWVGVEELRMVLPAMHGRQMQRHIDALAGIDFPVEYESKTRGRYRLTLPAEAVRVDLDENGLENFIGIRNALPGGATQPLALPHGQVLLESFSRLALADSQYYDGKLGRDASHAYHLYLRESERAPPQLRGITLLRLARTCRRLNRYDEALAALRRLDALLRDTAMHFPGLEIKARLCRAMLFFDQGRTDRAAALVDGLDVRGCTDASALGEYYNVKGLLAHRELCRRRAAMEKKGKDAGAADGEPHAALAAIAAHYYQQALALHSGGGDYQAMQCASFNLGNLLLYAWKEGLAAAESEAWLTQGIKWVAQCEFICNKFGVGTDSVWSRIVLLKTALDAGFEIDRLNALVGGDLFRNHASLEKLAQEVLKEAEGIGNFLEQAEALEILMRLALKRDDRAWAQTCRDRAGALYRELKREDMARRLKEYFPEE